MGSSHGGLDNSHLLALSGSRVSAPRLRLSTTLRRYLRPFHVLVELAAKVVEIQNCGSRSGSAVGNRANWWKIESPGRKAGRLTLIRPHRWRCVY